MAKAPKIRTPNEILLAACAADYNRHFDTHEIVEVAELVRHGFITIDHDCDGVKLLPTDRGMLIYYRHMVEQFESKVRETEDQQRAAPPDRAL